MRTAVLVIATVVAACCAGGGVLAAIGLARSQQAGSTSGGAGANSAVGPRPLGLNQPARDGKFEFVARSVSCGHDFVGTQWLRDEPQGQFCVVELTVTNIGTEAQRFADGNQRAFGPGGEGYAADTGAGVGANGNGDAVWNVINPGNTLAAKVVFDIPRGASIVRLELHDSGLSRGVTILVRDDRG